MIFYIDFIITLNIIKSPDKSLRPISNVPFSTRTIQWRLKEENIRKWRAVKRALLDNDHAKQRLKWARNHQHWTVEQWSKVVWSDESAIKKDSDTKTVEVRGIERENVGLWNGYVILYIIQECGVNPLFILCSQTHDIIKLISNKIVVL